MSIENPNAWYNIDHIEYFVEYNLDGGPIVLVNHRWLLEEILDVLKRVNNGQLVDGRQIKCSHLIKELENTLKDQREKK